MTDDRTNSFGPGPTGLYRNPAEGRLAGVCAGLADYFGVSPATLGSPSSSCRSSGFSARCWSATSCWRRCCRPGRRGLFRDAEDEAFWRSVARRPPHKVGGLARRFRDLDDRLARMERRVTSPDEVLRARFREL